MLRKAWPLLLFAPLATLLLAYALLAGAEPPTDQPEVIVESEVVVPEPLDPVALGQLKDRLGHKPFEGTLFQTGEPLTTVPLGKSPSLLKAAHLLDDAAYVLEQAELFPNAEAIRTQANELRAQAKHARYAGELKSEAPAEAGGGGAAGR